MKNNFCWGFNWKLLLSGINSILIKRFFATPPVGGFAQNDIGFG